MKKQDYIDMGLSSGLSLQQIENILCQVMGVTRSQFFVLQDISSRFIYEVQQYFYHIQNGAPQEYMLQKANFYGRDFFVDARVLIPRNDTEILVKSAINYMLKNGNIISTAFIDVGTGSGCIPISIVCELLPLKFFKTYALDISSDVLEVAQKNRDTYKLIDIIIQKSDLLEMMYQENILLKKSILITANLPYIRDGDSKNMDTSVIKYEPKGALYGGKNTGFELYEKLIKQCFQLRELLQLRSINLFIEIGFDQYEVSKTFLESLGLSFEYFKDSANIYRVVHIHGFNT